jgi:hypothetical protein
MTELICPRTYDGFYRLMKQPKLYTDAEIKMLYQANEKLKTNYVGGNSIICQHGGVECLTLHNIYRYSLGVLLGIGGVYCGMYKRPEVTDAIYTFLEMLKTAFDADNFKHIWDIVGKTQLGFGFMERVTKYLLEAFQKPSEKITMTWMKNLFELFCKVENEEKIESVEKNMKTIVDNAINEMFGAQISPLLQQQQPIHQEPTNNIVYNGKIIKIEMGDAMITISPNIFKSRRVRSSSAYGTPPLGGVKTRRKKNGKKRRY